MIATLWIAAAAAHLTPDGWGAVKIGMSQAEVARALGAKLEGEPIDDATTCLEQISGAYPLNLCVNARDAMPNGGQLSILAEEVAIGPRSTPKMKPGLYVRLSVIDAGCGMEPETLARAVEPFYSTKSSGAAPASACRWFTVWQRSWAEVLVSRALRTKALASTFTCPSQATPRRPSAGRLSSRSAPSVADCRSS